MTIDERRFRIIIVLAGQTDYISLSDLVSLVDAGRKSTIRSDIVNLERYFHISSKPGRYGGYRLDGAKSIFYKHAVMLMRLQQYFEELDKWIDNYDPELMKQAITALLEVRKSGSSYYL